jgi:predicted transcriptional regulator
MATPVDIPYDEYVRQEIQRGIDDVDAGRVVSHAEVKRLLRERIRALRNDITPPDKRD